MATKKLYTKETYSKKDKGEWLNHRGLGGTSASAITGNSPYKNILELYADIMCPSKSEVESTNESMTYGILCEPIIRKLFAIDFKKYKVHTPKGIEMYRRIDKPYMTATLESTLIEVETGRTGQKAGAKCPVKRLWISSLTEESIREGFSHLLDKLTLLPGITAVDNAIGLLH